MDIHPPQRHVRSLKEFFRELLTITAGILIALSLNGILDWRHHRDLVREARANIVSELQGNQRVLSTELHDLDRMEGQVRALITLVHQLEAAPDQVVHSVPYAWSLAELHATSWNTAQRTGALSYMPYEEVKRYTAVYDFQSDFQTVQQRGFGASLDVGGLQTLLGRNARMLNQTDLSDAERKLGVAQANVGALKEFASSLQRLYTQVLGAQQ